MSSLIGWFGRFRRAPEEDYETTLEKLALSIERRKSHLSEIRLRERRASLLVTMYTLAAWLLYVSIWYMGFAAKDRATQKGMTTTRRFLRTAPLVLGPFVILFTRRVVQLWYASKGNAEEKTLQLLLKERRTKVEEIKKKTNYYSTRSLIERFDESDVSPFRRSVMPSTPQKFPPSTSLPPLMNVQYPPAKLPDQQLQQRFSRHPQQPQTPARKQWYDRLADALLGTDDESVPVTHKYALICEKCFTHNGLVEPDKLSEVQYVCPKCNHFNAPARSNHRTPPRASLSPSPSSPDGPTPSCPSPVAPTGDLSFLPSSPTFGKEKPSTKPDVPDKEGTGEVSMMMIDS